jgi:glycosyltransferase involved in cell wall biosynthesis
MVNSHVSDINLNVAYVGTLVQHKGSDILYQLMNLHLPVNWFICGFIEDTSKKWSDYADVYGSYQHVDEMLDYLDRSRVDIVIMPSVCPESYSYTLSELWRGGYPVLSTNRGAIGNRISCCGGGWICEPCYLSGHLVWLYKNPCEIELVVARVNHLKLRKVSEMLNDYNDLYKTYMVK